MNLTFQISVILLEQFLQQQLSFVGIVAGF